MRRLREKQRELTQTGQTIAAMDVNEVLLDRHVKKLLACKPILACILHETVSECAGLTREQVEQCIEGTPQIEEVPVFPVSELLTGQAQEDFLEGEGLIRYDIRTYLRLPGNQEAEQIKILVDVEAQKDDKPGYDIPLRALFYCSRMISSQLGTEFSNQQDDPVKYGNIKKVYSIWICSSTAQKRANSADKYTIRRETIIGQNTDEPRYDIINAVVVNIGEKHDAGASESRMIQMLNGLFDETLDVRKKLKRLEECGIAVTREVETEVGDMCSYTRNILEKGFTQGREEGREEGRAEGREKEIFLSVQENDYSAERGAQKLGIPIAEFEKRMIEAGYRIPELLNSRDM